MTLEQTIKIVFFLHLITFRRYEPTLCPTSYSTSAAILQWTFVLPPLYCSLKAVWIEPLRGGVHQGSRHCPDLTPLTFLPSLSSPVSADYWFYLIRFSLLCILFSSSVFFSPSSNTQRRWERDIISSWFYHWIQWNFLLGHINRNVITQLLKFNLSWNKYYWALWIKTLNCQARLALSYT